MLPPLSLNEDNRSQKFQLQLLKVGVILSYLLLNQPPFAVLGLFPKVLLHKVPLLLLVRKVVRLIVPYFLQIDRSCVFISNVSKLPIVDNLYIVIALLR